MTEAGEILVVDDDKGMLWTLEEILRLEGLRPVGAASGPEAIGLALKQSFAAALLDINMPGLDGLKTLRELRRLQPDLPAVFMTAYPLPDTFSSADTLAVKGVFSKPLDIERLVSLLRGLLVRV